MANLLVGIEKRAFARFSGGFGKEAGDEVYLCFA
jgi:hypothetical protein